MLKKETACVDQQVTKGHPACTHKAQMKLDGTVFSFVTLYTNCNIWNTIKEITNE